MITAQTPFRQVGRVPYDVWSKAIAGYGGRPEYATRGAMDACGTLGAIALAFLFQESKYDTEYDSNSPDNWNAFNIRIPSKKYEGEPRGYIAFDNAVDSCAHFRGRINGEQGYFEGENPYLDDSTIAQLLQTYAPIEDNPYFRLLEELLSNLNSYLPDWRAEVPIDPFTGEIVTGRGSEPASTYRPLNKQDGQGVNWSTPQQHIGMVAHETQGDPRGEGTEELDWYYDFFNCPNGERCGNAAAHHVVARNGMAYTLIDPMSSLEPWINGGSPANYSHPVGGAWNSTFGAGKRNRLLRGIEFIKGDAQPLTEAQIKWGGQMFAAIYDAKGLRWTEYPRYRGVQQLLQHNWLAPTSCGIDAAQFNQMLAIGQSWVRLWQLGNAPDPTDPVPPTGPRVLFSGVDVELAKSWFGSVTKGGRTYALTDPLGPAANLWLERGKQTGSFPDLVSVDEFLDGRMYLRFRDGFVLWRPNRSVPLAVLKG
jgi:hypothetical protein